jgi:MULE transposase domain
MIGVLGKTFNVGYKKIIKHDLLWKIKKLVVLGDYTLNMKRTRPCIAAFKYLRPVITIDAGFLSGRYKGRLLMACGYDVENKLLPLAFEIVNEENVDNWDWFMRWVCNELIKYNIKICVISDRHRGIKSIFERPHLGWSVQCGETVHRYCMQYVAENLYKKAEETGKKEDNLRDDFRRTEGCQIKKYKLKIFQLGVK